MLATPLDEAERLQALVAAEGRALALLDAVEAAEFIRPGRSEREVERDIYALAAERFGVATHWHKRIVRAGANTLAIFSDNPPVLTIAADDIVFVDVGPVFGEWEADVGRSYALGDDPAKHALVATLPVQFEAVRAEFLRQADITGAELYQFACESAAAAGWRFGGTIAGHLVADFPHARLPNAKALGRIAPGNDRPLRAPDALGRKRHWILEIHLVSRDGGFGGFYERLMLEAEGRVYPAVRP